MNEWMNACLIAIIVLDIYILGTSRLITVIKATILQGILMGILPLGGNSEEMIHHWILSISVLLSNVILMPSLAIMLLKKVEIHREVEPFLPFIPSMLFGMLIGSFSFWITPYFQKVLDLQDFPIMLMPAAVTTAVSGFLILASRRKAVTQVLGYLVMENGIYIWGLTLLDRMPLLVELGVILGIFMTVMVMATVSYRVYLKLGHVNVDELSKLKG